MGNYKELFVHNLWAVYTLILYQYDSSSLHLGLCCTQTDLLSWFTNSAREKFAKYTSRCCIVPENIPTFTEDGWNFQFSLLLSLKSFAYWDPIPTPLEFPMTSLEVVGYGYFLDNSNQATWKYLLAQSDWQHWSIQETDSQQNFKPLANEIDVLH